MNRWRHRLRLTDSNFNKRGHCTIFFRLSNAKIVSITISCNGILAHTHHIITARKRSLGQGDIFSSVCQEFCPQGGLPQCMLGYHPPGTRLPPGSDTPRPGTPRPSTPLRSASWEIRSRSGRYASYWNAIFFVFVFSLYTCKNILKTTMSIRHLSQNMPNCW